MEVRCFRKAIILIIISIFAIVQVYAMPNKNLLPEIDDSKGIVDYNPESMEITTADVYQAEESNSGWTSSSRGGILSSVGFFNYGDTVFVKDDDGKLLGKYIVYATSTYEEGDRETEYKLLKPIYKRFSSPRTVPSGKIVKKHFTFVIEPTYSALYKGEYGLVHKADISLFMPKILHPVSIVFGPTMVYKQTGGTAVLGGFLGGEYDLPLDYMANTITNLHFMFDFKCLLGTAIQNGDSFYYGYDFSIGIKWYPWYFLSLKLQFTMSALYSSENFAALYSGYGATFGVGFEI